MAYDAPPGGYNKFVVRIDYDGCWHHTIMQILQAFPECNNTADLIKKLVDGENYSRFALLADLFNLISHYKPGCVELISFSNRQDFIQEVYSAMSKVRAYLNDMKVYNPQSLKQKMRFSSIVGLKFLQKLVAAYISSKAFGTVVELNKLLTADVVRAGENKSALRLEAFDAIDQYFLERTNIPEFYREVKGDAATCPRRAKGYIDEKKLLLSYQQSHAIASKDRLAEEGTPAALRITNTLVITYDDREDLIQLAQKFWGENFALIPCDQHQLYRHYVINKTLKLELTVPAIVNNYCEGTRLRLIKGIGNINYNWIGTVLGVIAKIPEEDMVERDVDRRLLDYLYTGSLRDGPRRKPSQAWQVI
jgi:hypothetical protein